MKAANCGEPLRLLLAECARMQRDLLTSALRRRPGLSVNSCTLDSRDCLALLKAREIDVLLVGATVPENFNAVLELVQTVHSSFPDLPVVALLNASERDVVITLSRAGVRGLFCFPSASLEAFCKCIRAVHEGQIWMNTEEMSFIVQALNGPLPVSVVDAKGNTLLTTRESQVVGLVAEGMSNRAAAQQLKVSENSIKKSLLRTYDKLGISNRVELVMYAMSQRQTKSETRHHSLAA